MKLREQERVVWALAVCVLAGGYFVTTQRYEQQIAASKGRAQMLYEKATLNRRIISQGSKAEALHRELRAHLDGVLFARRSPLTTATLLHDLDILAHRDGIEVVAIAPQARSKDASVTVTASSTSDPQTPQPGALENEAIDISARGHFSNLLRFVAQLPRQHVLLRVNQVNFSLSGSAKRDANKPFLDAKIHALLYRLARRDLLGAL